MRHERFRIGTRGSALALWQAKETERLLTETFEGAEISIVRISTKGDEVLDKPLTGIGDKGLFTKEIEDALFEDRIDLAVHSLKDLPTELPEGLGIAAVLRREEPRDVFVSRDNTPLSEMGSGAVIGTSSLRRTAQLKRMRPDLVIKDIRGNVETRIGKVLNGDYDGTILAFAGVKRLGLTDRIAGMFSLEEMLPAPGQGIIAIEAKTSSAAYEALRAVNDTDSEICALAERAFLRTLEGGCQVPVAANAYVSGRNVVLKGRVISAEGEKIIEGTLESGISEAERTGKELARRLIGKGAKEILDERG